MITEKLAWYVSRSSGLMAWVLATSSVIFGLALSTRLVRRKGVPAWLNALHRYLGTLTLVFTAVHLGALVADNWVYFGAAELFVPMKSAWRPGAVAWGIVAMYALVAVQLTSWCKRWLPRRLWHSVHLLSIPMFVFGTVHGFQSGADRQNMWVQWGALTGSVSLLFLLLFRVTSESGSRRRRSSSTGGGGATAADRVAALRLARGSTEHRDALGDERGDRGVQPGIGERVRQLR